MKHTRSEKLIKVWTVCPNDMELSTVHCSTKEQAEDWAKTYKSGAQVFENEMPERILNQKAMQIARRGYGI